MEILLLVGFVIIAILFLAVGYFVGKALTNLYWEKFKVPKLRLDAIAKSRAVLGGQFSEQLAPYLPDFPWSPTEVRFIGKPIDFIVFKGMDEKDIKEVEFVEVKSGKSQLNTHERKLRDVIKDKKVRWAEYRIPEDITKKREGVC